MSWRPSDWITCYQDEINGEFKDNYMSDAFEAGADAMLESLFRMAKEKVTNVAEHKGDLYIACGKELYRWDGDKPILIHTFKKPISCLYATEHHLYISEKTKFEKLT